MQLMRHAVIWLLLGAVGPLNTSAESALADEPGDAAARMLWEKYTTFSSDATRDALLANPDSLDVLIVLLYDEPAKGANWPMAADERKQLQIASMGLLDSHWPADQLRSAARKNLKRLSKVEEIPFRGDERPIMTLLASLRHSLDPVDRDLLGWFAESASDASAELALNLMPSGYRGVIRNPLADHWKNPPPHDYTAVYLKCFDPKRPKTLMRAITLASSPQAVEGVEKLLKEDLPPETRHRICSLLYGRSKQAREYFLERLSSQDAQVFQEAFDRVTGNWGYGDARPLVPYLMPQLEGNDPARRKQVIKRMGGLKGPGAMLLAETLAPHLLSDDWRERVLTAEALLHLEFGDAHSPQRNGILLKVSEKTKDVKVQDRCQELLRSPNDALKKLAGQAASAATTPKPAISAAEFSELERKWWKWTQEFQRSARERDPAAKSELQKGGEAGLEVLLDILHREQKQISIDQFDALVKQLGSDEFTKREAAMEQILVAGSSMSGALQKYVLHEDPEIRSRIVTLLAKIDRTTRPEHELDHLRQAATDILIHDWPQDQQRAVTKRNLDRLAGIRVVPHHVSLRPAQILLASLRYSEVPADRELLAILLLKSEPGAATMAMSVMKDGIAGYGGLAPASDWRRVPFFNYNDIYWNYLDPSQPDLFKQALYHIEDKKRLAVRLRELLKTPLNDSMQETIHGYLWHAHGDAPSGDFFADKLKSDDDREFQRALMRLTDSRHAYRGTQVIPKLVPSLQAVDDGRRILALDRLGNYLGEPSVKLAAETAAPFLVSRFTDERQAAEKVLFELQRKGWVNVFDHIAVHSSNPPVRDAAKTLKIKWNAANPPKPR